MGCCGSCFGGKKQAYEPIPEKAVDVNVSPKFATQSYSNSTDSHASRSQNFQETESIEVNNVIAADVIKDRPKTPPKTKAATPTAVAPPVLLELSPSPQPVTPPPAVVATKSVTSQPITPQAVTPQPITSQSVSATSVSGKPYDESLSVFKGTLVEQKFSNKSNYDTKFAWINWEHRSLNLSEHMTKERRHKEASLVDVISVIPGAPEKFKGATTPNGGSAPFPDPHLCLTVKFVRGGGIDLKFKTETDRNLWQEEITKLIGKK